MATGLHGVTAMATRMATAVLLAALALSASAQTVRYIHTDALGSVAVVTDQNRNVLERREYEPYGFQLTPAIKDGPGYTGHVQDAATGLTYMQQRYYDPQIGLFLSVDPVAAYSNPMGQFHRYKYANNSPYRFIDPDGRVSDEPERTPHTPGTMSDTAEVQPTAQGDVKTLETVTVTAESSQSSNTGFYGSSMELNHNFEVVAAYGAGLRYKRDMMTQKDALGIVFLGLGGRLGGPAKSLTGAPSIDLLKGGYAWGNTNAPIDIEFNGALGPLGAGLEFDPGRGVELSLNAAWSMGSYAGGSVMIDDTVVPD